MRWFVEVSHLDGEFAEEKLCVDAKQWQAALQQARKLRGDSGPLSAFSIELLDDGYRAVNLGRKLRYVVVRAPVDAALSTPDSIVKAREQAATAGKKAADSKSAPNSSALAVKGKNQTALTAKKADLRKKGPKPGAKKPAEAKGSRATQPPKSVPRAVTKPPTAGKSPALKLRTDPVSATAKAATSLHPSAQSSRPPTEAPRPSSSAPSSRRGSMGARMITIQPSSPPELDSEPSSSMVHGAGGVEGSSALASKAVPGPSSAAPAEVPSFQVVRRREVEPTEETPLVYREVAYAVPAGCSQSQVEGLLLQELTRIKQSLADRAPGKLVQLAAFDHAFERRPSRAPLGTLIWKDWRGEPQLQFPPAGTPATSLRPPDVSMPPRPAPSEKTSDASSAVASAPQASEETTRPRAVAESPKEEATADVPSRPLRRRSPEVDLIGELFETMHELHFLQDIVAGADFVMSVLEETIPSRLVFVHVFDINTRDFVLVRQSGASDEVLLQRVPDTDPLLDQVMHLGRVSVDDASKDERFKNGRWATTGSAPGSVLCGAVRQGGRYLGLIELADPLGKQPYFETEANALEYICGQFAEFIANRPIVIDAEAVLGHG